MDMKITFRRSVFYLMMFQMLIYHLSCSKVNEKAGNPNFDKIYPIALRGDLSKVFCILDTLDTFPRLTSADLEYRAKLVELVKSQETTYELIKKFIGNAAKTQSNPHAYANYYLISRLSEMIFDKDFVSDMEEWKEINVKLIREKSHQLFDDHSMKLQELDYKTITHLITEI